MISPCPVCYKITTLLPDGKREAHYPSPRITLTPKRLCSGSGCMVFVWPSSKMMSCGICGARVFVDDNDIFQAHFDAYRRACYTTGRDANSFPPRPASDPFVPTKTKFCARCNRDVSVNVNGEIIRHYPGPDQTYSADRYCGQDYPAWVVQTEVVWQPGQNAVYNL